MVNRAFLTVLFALIRTNPARPVGFRWWMKCWIKAKLALSTGKLSIASRSFSSKPRIALSSGPIYSRSPPHPWNPVHDVFHISALQGFRPERYPDESDHVVVLPPIRICGSVLVAFGLGRFDVFPFSYHCCFIRSFRDHHSGSRSIAHHSCTVIAPCLKNHIASALSPEVEQFSWDFVSCTS